MEQIGFHPAAVAATSDAARALRDDADRAAAAAPHETRAAFTALRNAPPSAERTAALQEATARAYAAFNRHDWELNTNVLHPDRYTFEAGEDDAGLLDLPRLLEGPEEYIQGMVRWQSAWSEITLLSEGVVDAGPDRLLNWARFVMQGSGSGIGLEQSCAVIYEFEHEWVVRQRYWWDIELGTRAAGLEPDEVEAALAAARPR